MTAKLLRGSREAVLWLGALAGLLAVAAGIAVVVLNASFLVFRSGSMSPAIDTGALAVATPVRAPDIRPGDVVSVRAEDGSQITHRVVSSTLRGDEASLVLRGDANPTPDAEVYVVRSVPRVHWSVPLAGYAVALALTPSGIVAIGALCGVLLLISPAAGPVPDRRRRGGVHRGGRRARPVGVAASVAATVVVAASVSGTQAAYTDAATMASDPFTARTIAAPTGVGCVNSGINDYIQWTAPAGPPPTGYRVSYTNTVTAVTQTQDVAATPLQWRPPTTPTATYSVRVAAMRGSWVSPQSATGAEITGQVVVIFSVYSC